MPKRVIIFTEDEYKDIVSSLKRAIENVHKIEDGYVKNEVLRHLEDAYSSFDIKER